MKTRYEINHYYHFDELESDVQAGILRKMEQFHDKTPLDQVEVFFVGVQDLRDLGRDKIFLVFNFKPGQCGQGGTSFYVPITTH